MLSSRIELSTLNQSVLDAQYAVRGPIVTRSQELAAMLKSGVQGVDLPFDSVVSCNIGNPQALGQKHLSYIRDVLSLVINPDLQDRAAGLFPADIVERARRYLASIPNAGAYTESQGIPAVREEVAAFLEDRDGYSASPGNIFLTNGASEGVRFCMQTIIRSPTLAEDGSERRDGVLTPIPQYPLYSALTTLLRGALVPYYLREESEWGCSVGDLSASLQKAKEEGTTVRALVVINPGNPTGQVLSEVSMREIVAWCREQDICLMADEVYQENIWKEGSRFVSFRKVAFDLDAFSGDRPLQLISFHSISKGFLGECGLRGGYFEILGFPLEVKQEIIKLSSISLCSNTIGQLAVGLMVNPPKPESESFSKYDNERLSILSSLRRRAEKMSRALNQLEGVSCNNIEGALYAFPKITLPARVLEAAAANGVQPDAYFCLSLLENTGIVVVPGSGFGQENGTYHFRTTILPPEDKLDAVIDRLKVFHSSFLEKYA